MKHHKLLNEENCHALHDLIRQNNISVTNARLHPLQNEYIGQQILNFDEEEDIMTTLHQISDAMYNMAACTKLANTPEMQDALLKDMQLMKKLFNLLHSFKASPIILEAAKSA